MLPINQQNEDTKDRNLSSNLGDYFDVKSIQAGNYFDCRMDQLSNGHSMYIPRVALSSSSSSSKSSSRLKEFANKKRRDNFETSGESESEGIYGSSIQNYDTGVRPDRSQMYLVHKAPKRGSHSTQSSSASSTSNHSVYSVNSLLLSVENLENFNRSSEPKQKPSFVYSENNPNIILKSNFDYQINHDSGNFDYPIYEHRWKMLQNIKSISTLQSASLTTIDGKQQGKEVDEISTTSSKTNTNFTVVSLNDSHQRLTKSKAICTRSHQITILIFIMTLIFTIGISLMLILMDMRNQKMPR